MNTTEAAAKAGVTAATIRHWARYGAITATKNSGKWTINPDSLEHRIAMTAKPHTPKPLTAEDIIALGGSRWTKNGMDRVYLNSWAQYAGIASCTPSTTVLGRSGSATSTAAAKPSTLSNSSSTAS